ncbi:hypothetical protein BJ508DRAFT_416734 [Ascobolus immersus RN42]|uniref:ABC transporter domain-containing protein n=1 Tax=Ascobolus immersus RN42 TaxID=1160509 RepID=A0A3N4HWF9_ASCIM|nr:hypothetical protein BJ508DRAFT_416734 [Ascobolus immersus RN42]
MPDRKERPNPSPTNTNNSPTTSTTAVSKRSEGYKSQTDSRSSSHSHDSDHYGGAGHRNPAPGSHVTPGLQWDNLDLTVQTGKGKKKNEKVLLRKVSGYCHRGEMTAILGPSGSGKTSLTSVLTGRVGGMKNYKLTGSVTFQGDERREGSWKSTTGYVEQNDLLYDSLTVEETIIFSAMMRLPAKTYSRKQKIERAREVIDMLGLTKVKDTWVGSDSKRGVSGGERKRTSVGVELVTAPKLLFLDEPTSGLDSQSAYTVISNLRDIAGTGVAVLCTIHQPSWDLFKKFDRIYLIAEGECAFHGTIPEAIDWFTDLGYPVPKGQNAADHFITLLTPGMPVREDDSGNSSSESLTSNNDEKDSSRVQKILAAWRERGHEVQDLGKVKTNVSIPATKEEDKPGFSSPYWEELYWLLRRGYTQSVRDKTFIITGLFQSIFMGLILSFAFYRLGTDQKDVISRLGLLFFIPINNTFSILFPLISLLPLQNGILVRERRAGSYRVSSFFISRLLIDIPISILTRVVFYVMIYWISAFKPTASAFWLNFTINTLTVVFGVTMSLFIGSCSQNLQIVQAIAPAMNVVFIIFSGFLLPLSNIPPWFIWIRWISYAGYVFNGLALLEFKGRKFNCPPSSKGNCYRTGEDVIRQYDLDRFSVGANIGFTCLLICVSAVMAYFALRRLTRPNLKLRIKEGKAE